MKLANQIAAYRIPECNLDSLRGQLERLNRRATKLGVKPVTLRETGEELELWAEPHLEGRRPGRRPFHVNLTAGWSLSNDADRAMVERLPNFVPPIAGGIWP